MAHCIIHTRKDIELIEKKILADYAMKSHESSGRLFDEAKHERRTCYQRDRDRIVHCQAFRKLEYKTQVFVIFEGDYYRTRLTHTIEVAQIARTIGRTLRLNEDLVEAIALAHDLGHPPFGHAGEKALDRIMRAEDYDGFNHNYRSFEIVSQEERRYPRFDGLNLTEEVLVGILKHETDFDVVKMVSRYKKIGPTLEARVVDVADSLAYLSHDIDDGIASGCIVEKDLMVNKFWQKAQRNVDAKLLANDPQMFRYQVVRNIIDLQMTDLIRQTEKNLKKHDFYSAQDVKSFHLENPKKNIIAYSSQMKKERDSLQALLYEKLYHHYRVERMTEKARRILEEIFKVYQRNPRQLPYDIFQRGKKFSRKVKFRIICNYIASMTDRFALDEHKKLFNPYQKV
ncbi:MAG: deoxyguanosinetriphosphate triphosphohydrolase [Candidatus Omnitrophica bacterium]|nr:deoxyguanosinetriphosphate triphosphohydrolase [Candidatus Omnitrophota bacterium]